MTESTGGRPSPDNSLRGEIRRRIRTMLILGAAGAVIAFAIGFRWAALGVVAGAPVGIFNYWLMISALDAGRNVQSTREPVIILKRSLLRLGIDILALGLSVLVNPEFMIGVLIGLLIELGTYYVDLRRIFAEQKR